MQSESSPKKSLYSFYKEHLSESRVFINAGHLWTLRLRPLLKRVRGERYAPPSWKRAGKCRPLSKIRLAVICDEMTWCNFVGECELVHLTPQNWREQLEQFRPDAFFCESAWEGSEESGAGWRWRIYRNHELWFENRRELLDILRYCKEAEIPTLFWNKEDPPSFSCRKYDFVDTALLFDHIFTTAEECVKNYTDAGHKSVHTLMFGFSPRIFNPQPYVERNSAVFHGSWYAIHPKRCEDMRQVFDMLLGMKIPLTIYDRQSASGNPLAVFPDEYKPFVRPSVPYDRITETLADQSFAVNINTVTGSETMFARRVFEMMACGLIVISNRSVGIERIFGSRVWFSDAEFDLAERKKIRRENIADVFLHHTWRQRILSMLSAAGIEVGGAGVNTAVIYQNGSAEDCRKHFDSLSLDGASGWLRTENGYTPLCGGQAVPYEEALNGAEYFFSADCGSPIDDAELMIAMTEFTDPNVAVAVGSGEFACSEKPADAGWLIPAKYIGEWEKNKNIVLPVYLI